MSIATCELPPDGRKSSRFWCGEMRSNMVFVLCRHDNKNLGVASDSITFPPTADVLEVRGEGATLRVPLDGSTAALGRLEACFDKNSRSGVETNPFVSPSRKP